MITSTKKSVVLLLAFVSLFCIPAFGQVTVTEVQKLFASQKDDFDRFGWSVALDDDTAIIGANRADNNGMVDNGAAYVFTRADGTWTEQAKLLASDKKSNDWFGISVALDGNTVIVGATCRFCSSTSSIGAAYVFTRSDGTWTEQAKLLASDKDDGDHFGFAVALDGNTAVVGAYGQNDDGMVNNGAAYVFTHSDGAWTEQAKLLASDKDDDDHFGYSVALDGDTLLVGARGASGGGTAYVFTRSDGTWTEQKKLLASDRTSGDLFGTSVAVDDDTALVGASREFDSENERNGAAYVFTLSDGSWTEQAKLPASKGVDHFGRSVALDGNTAVIGADDESDFDTRANGAAYVFIRSGRAWTAQFKLLASDKADHDQFGWSVAADAGTAFVGAPYKVRSGWANGSAYVFAPIGVPSVEIDVKPGSNKNPINLKASKGTIPVAILTTDTFDATQVNWETVRFGPSGATERHERVHVRDTDRDGDMDAKLHFRTRDTGISCGDTEATLTGETFAGDVFAGTDVIKVVKCPKEKRR